MFPRSTMLWIALVGAAVNVILSAGCASINPDASWSFLLGGIAFAVCACIYITVGGEDDDVS